LQRSQGSGAARPRLLYLTQELPFADDAGHKIRSRQLLRALARAFDVTAAGFVDAPAAPAEARVLGLDTIAEASAIRIRRQPVRLAGAVLASLARDQPYGLAKFENRRLARRLAAHAHAQPPAIVVANVAMARYLDLFPMAQGIVDSHNIEAALWRDFSAAAPPLTRGFLRREARLLERVETAMWARAAGVIAICAEDAEVIARHAPGTRVIIAPPAVAPGTLAATRGPRADVGMLGVWSWAPNEHALEVFTKRMAPRLREAGVSIRISGPGMAAGPRQRLQRIGVEVTGRVGDVADFYGGVDQVVAPYVQGGGVRLKVLEAIAYGVPLVGTPLAFRGVLGCELPQADICGDPAALVERLLAKRARIDAARADAARLREAVLRAHDADRIGASLTSFLAGRLPGEA